LLCPSIAACTKQHNMARSANQAVLPQSANDFLLLRLYCMPGFSPLPPTGVRPSPAPSALPVEGAAGGHGTWQCAAPELLRHLTPTAMLMARQQAMTDPLLVDSEDCDGDEGDGSGDDCREIQHRTMLVTEAVATMPETVSVSRTRAHCTKVSLSAVLLGGVPLNPAIFGQATREQVWECMGLEHQSILAMFCKQTLA
jgi:hypothetical protein